MDSLQRIDTLLQVDVIRRQLGLVGVNVPCQRSVHDPRFNPPRGDTDLVLGLAELLLRVLESTRGKRRDLATERAALHLLSAPGASPGIRCDQKTASKVRT
jgi:hypothetical protein